jgi:hypothetical protein
MSWVLVPKIVTDFHTAYPAKHRPWARQATSRFSLIHYMVYFLVSVSHSLVMFSLGCFAEILYACMFWKSPLVTFLLYFNSQFPNPRNPEQKTLKKKKELLKRKLDTLLSPIVTPTSPSFHPHLPPHQHPCPCPWSDEMIISADEFAPR